MTIAKLALVGIGSWMIWWGWRGTLEWKKDYLDNRFATPYGRLQIVNYAVIFLLGIVLVAGSLWSLIRSVLHSG